MLAHPFLFFMCDNAAESIKIIGRVFSQTKTSTSGNKIISCVSQLIAEEVQGELVSVDKKFALNLEKEPEEKAPEETSPSAPASDMLGTVSWRETIPLISNWSRGRGGGRWSNHSNNNQEKPKEKNQSISRPQRKRLRNRRHCSDLEEDDPKRGQGRFSFSWTWF